MTEEERVKRQAEQAQLFQQARERTGLSGASNGNLLSPTTPMQQNVFTFDPQHANQQQNNPGASITHDIMQQNAIAGEDDNYDT